MRRLCQTSLCLLTDQQTHTTHLTAYRNSSTRGVIEWFLLVMDKQRQRSDQDRDAHIQQSLVPTASNRRSRPHHSLRQTVPGASFFDVYHRNMLTVQNQEDKGSPISRLTMTLHKEQDGKPAITLTTYMFELPERPAARFSPTLRKSDGYASPSKALTNGGHTSSRQLHRDEHSTDDVGLVFDHIE